MSRHIGRIREATEEIQERAGGVVESVRDIAETTKEAARERATRARDKAADMFEHTRERIVAWEGDLEEYIRREPVKSLLIAAGVGLLMGAIWRRRT